jgi:BirA family biotin operon repressor/biotin-[acetyl-CoA-carboxylase] ligase
MDQAGLENLLASLPLGPLRYLERVDSTNTEAATWVTQGAPDLALVVADEQTAGRGRLGRHWYTPAGAALAFSLVLRFSPSNLAFDPPLGRVPALGALALSQALETLGLVPQIKWPNDLLVGQRKLAGVLVETSWQGEGPLVAVLGLGVNVSAESVPPEDWPGATPAGLLFPATCLETELGRPLDRWQLLRACLALVLRWHPLLAAPQFLQAWEDRLAYRGQWVRISHQAGPPTQPLTGRLLGLDSSGALRLQTAAGESLLVQAGDLSLRPEQA